jgi:triacylglycerol lipase
VEGPPAWEGGSSEAENHAADQIALMRIPFGFPGPNPSLSGGPRWDSSGTAARLPKSLRAHPPDNAMMPTFYNFEPNTTIWNPANAVALVQASSLAYGATADISSGFAAWGFTDVAQVAGEDDIFAVVASNPSVVLCAFRGTISEKDGVIDMNNWMSDADAWQTPYQSYFAGPALGGIHEGFAQALTEIWPGVTAAIAQARTNSQPLWMTGHSLGGALAYLATTVLNFTEREPVNGLYTFGQPRLGDPGFCNQCETAFGDIHYRFVNNEDVVTRVPPRIMPHIPIEYYGHSGRLVYFDSGGAPHSDEAFWNNFMAEVEVDSDNFVATLTGGPIKDHFIANYIALVSGSAANGSLGSLTW